MDQRPWEVEQMNNFETNMLAVCRRMGYDAGLRDVGLVRNG